MLSQNGLWKNKLGYCMLATMKVTAIPVKDFAAWRMKNAKTLLDLEMHPDRVVLGWYVDLGRILVLLSQTVRSLDFANESLGTGC